MNEKKSKCNKCGKTMFLNENKTVYECGCGNKENVKILLG